MADPGTLGALVEGLEASELALERCENPFGTETPDAVAANSAVRAYRQTNILLSRKWTGPHLDAFFSATGA